MHKIKPKKKWSEIYPKCRRWIVTLTIVKAAHNKVKYGQKFCLNGLRIVSGTGWWSWEFAYFLAPITKHDGIINCTPTPGYEPVIEANTRTLSLKNDKIVGKNIAINGKMNGEIWSKNADLLFVGDEVEVGTGERKSIISSRSDDDSSNASLSRSFDSLKECVYKN